MNKERGAPTEYTGAVHPDFSLSGLLREDAQQKAQEAGTSFGADAGVLKHSLPADAALPDGVWRLYIYDGDRASRGHMELDGKESFLVGTDDVLCDVVLGHQSIEAQHAVLVFREIVTETDEITGVAAATEVRPFLIDLETDAGTLVDGKRIKPARYVELLSKDKIQFGDCQWTFILLSAEK
jgi:FHA domain